MIRVLIADDSSAARLFLVEILRSDPELEIIGEAKDGREAVDLNQSLQPDVVTMDINMPGMDGFEATNQIMATRPVPIVIVSALEALDEKEATGRALTAGALTVLRKPPGIMDPTFQDVAKEIRSTIKIMSRALVRKSPGAAPAAPASSRQPAPAPPSAPRRTVAPAEKRCEVVAIAASAGGPAAIRALLSQLPRNFPAPILIVQQMTPGFIEGLALSWNTASSLPVMVAKHRDIAKDGMVYVAPDALHLGIGRNRELTLSNAGAIKGCRPSATYLFASLAATFKGALACVLLTGGGEDGIDGLRAIRATGAPVIAQDEATSVVFDNPKAAIAGKLCDHELSLAEIAPALSVLCGLR